MQYLQCTNKAPRRLWNLSTVIQLVINRAKNWTLCRLLLKQSNPKLQLLYSQEGTLSTKDLLSSFTLAVSLRQRNITLQTMSVHWLLVWLQHWGVATSVKGSLCWANAGQLHTAQQMWRRPSLRDVDKRGYSAGTTDSESNANGFFFKWCLHFKLDVLWSWCTNIECWAQVARSAFSHANIKHFESQPKTK